MIGGIESIHTWDSDLVLNDRSVYPYFRVDRIGGLTSSADFNPATDPAMGRTGEVPRISDRDGKTITYEGAVVCRSMGDLVSARAQLVAAFSGTDESRMDVEPHPDWTGDALPSRYYFARPLSADVSESQDVGPHRASLGYERAFSVAVRLSDPRYYDPDTVDVHDDTASAVDGSGVPFTPGGSGPGPDADGFEIVEVNPGNAKDSPAIFRMAGPLVNPVLSNESIGGGKFLRFSNLEIESGHSVTVDFRRRRAFRTDSGNNVRHTLDPSSTWWDRNVPCLIPGSNTLRLRGYAVGAGAQLRLIYNPADDA